MKSGTARDWWDDWMDLATRPDLANSLVEMNTSRFGQPHQQMGIVRLIELPPVPFTTPARIQLTWCIERTPSSIRPTPKTTHISVDVLGNRPCRIDDTTVLVSMGKLGYLKFFMRAKGVMRRTIEAWAIPEEMRPRIEEPCT